MYRVIVHSVTLFYFRTHVIHVFSDTDSSRSDPCNGDYVSVDCEERLTVVPYCLPC